MFLSAAQKQVISDALDAKTTGDLACPISGDTRWALENRIAYLQASHPSMGGGWDGRTYPNVVVVCPTCGYTMMVNLYYLGVAEEIGLFPGEVAAQNEVHAG